MLENEVWSVTLAVTPYKLYGEHIKTKMTQIEDKHTTGLFSRRCGVSIEASWTHPYRSLPCPVARFTVKQLSVRSLPGQSAPRRVLQIMYNSPVSNEKRSDPPFLCLDSRVYYDSLQSER